MPEDYSLVGFDDAQALPDRQGENMLTTVRVPLAAIGNRAAQLVIDRITGVIEEDCTMVLPVELVVRKSTGRPNFSQRG